MELTNLGAVPASVEGMTLRDNSGEITLPALVIPGGGMLVVTARLADVPGVTSFRLAQGIGNGLGNSGDRLALTTADGRQIDAFSYGDDTTYVSGARIPAPGTGRSIERRFGLDGGYRDAIILEQPSPGQKRAAPVAPGTPSTTGVPSALGAPTVAVPRVASSDLGGAPGTWVILLSLGAGLLGGAAMQRITAIAAERQR